MTSPLVFHWSDISGGGFCVAGTSLLKGPRAFPLHTHDFHEVFWIKSGRGVHRINGKEHPLHRGAMVWIRPSDCHGFRSDERGIAVQNVAFSPMIWRRLRDLFFPLDDHFWSSHPDDPPRNQNVGRSGVEILDGLFRGFVTGSPDEFHSLRLLMNIFEASGRAPAADCLPGNIERESLPDWLSEALIRFARNTDLLAGGTRALAKLAGRSPEHVSRTMRESAGITPRDWVTGQRLRHAAAQLRSTNRKILDISMECGFESLGHFYRAFAREYKVPPGDYRRKQTRPI